MIKLNNISYKYSNNYKALNNINIEINPKEITVIVGKNGSGKSTLGNVIAGLYKTTGKIYLEDIEYKKIKPKELRKNIGIVFQNPNNSIVFTSIKDDMTFTFKNLNVPEPEWNERINSSLNVVGMERYLNKNPYELSYGQKQRIAIANVLAIKPKYIIFDESTSMLDNEGKNNIYKIIRELKDCGMGIVFITNNIDEIKLADKIIFLKDGQIHNEIKKGNEKDLIKTLEELNFDLTFYYKLIKQSFKNSKIKEIIGEYDE